MKAIMKTVLNEKVEGWCPDCKLQAMSPHSCHRCDGVPVKFEKIVTVETDKVRNFPKDEQGYHLQAQSSDLGWVDVLPGRIVLLDNAIQEAISLVNDDSAWMRPTSCRHVRIVRNSLET